MGHDVSGVPVLSGAIRPAVEALNTLNLTGPAGEAGRGLTATRDVFDALGAYAARNPTALEQALGTTLQAASAVGRAGMLPYEGAFAALGGGLRGLRGLLTAA